MSDPPFLLLSDRIICSSSDDLIESGEKLPVRLQHSKLWSDENMKRAVAAVVASGISIRKAAIMYGIPKSTLGDRISGRVTEGNQSEPLRYLSAEEEQELVLFLEGCADIGYAKTVKEILAQVAQVLACRGVQKEVSNGWWEAFRKRDPKLGLRTAAVVSKSRATASNREDVDRYFDLLEETLNENDLRDKPGQIFNLDETDMPLDPKPPKTVHVRCDRNPIL